MVITYFYHPEHLKNAVNFIEFFPWMFKIVEFNRYFHHRLITMSCRDGQLTWIITELFKLFYLTLHWWADPRNEEWGGSISKCHVGIAKNLS